MVYLTITKKKKKKKKKEMKRPILIHTFNVHCTCFTTPTMMVYSKAAAAFTEGRNKR